jgi:putative ABC transport system permease protein
MLADLLFRLRALFNRSAVERELDDEVRFHLEHETEKLVRSGLSRDEAARRARVAFGGVERIKDDTRDVRGIGMIETVVQDARYAARGLRASPGFAAAVILTLGLGVGANAAMFGVVDRLLFRAPPGLRDARTVHRAYFHAAYNGRFDLRREMSIRRYFDLVRDTRSFSTLAAFQTRVLPVGIGDGSRERPVAVASATFFDFFEAPPALGRYFGPSDDIVPEGRRVAVLSHDFWRSEYGGRRDIIGARIRVDEMDCEIVGVAPRGFVGVGDQLTPALYVPLTAYAFSRAPRYAQTYAWSWVEVLARRRPDVSLEQATADLSTAYRRSWQADPRYARGDGLATAKARVELGPVQFARGPQAPRESKVATWIAGVTIVVLLIACANVANLLLSRGLRRQREIALRLALGVSRARLVQQLATETVLLAAAGAVCGLVMARWLAGALSAVFLADADATVLTDARTLLFAGALTICVALLTGILPALQASRAGLALALNAGARDAGAARSRTRALLVLAQSALCVLLLVGAGLFVRSFQHVRAMRLGYDVDPIIVVNESYRGTALTNGDGEALDARLLEEAGRIPGVVSASLAEAVPFWSNDEVSLFVEGIDSVARIGRFLQQAGSPGYFRTAGTRILRGRSFDATDDARSLRVMIVGERMAAALWPSQDPVGRCVRMFADTAPCVTVVGVAEEMRLRSLSDRREYSFYIPAAQYGGPTGTLFVRVDGDAAVYAEPVRKRLQALMPGSAYVTSVPLSQHVEPSMRSWRFGATMFMLFGGLALVLAALGLYSVIAYSVAVRRREIGVRIALGATRQTVMRLVVGHGVRLTLAGVALGAGIAVLAGRWIEPLLFEQSARDPVVFGSVALLLLAISAFATAAPALWASRVDPNVTLRAD